MRERTAGTPAQTYLWQTLHSALADVQVAHLFFLFWPFGFIDRKAEELDRKQGEREGEWHTAKGPRPGVKPRSAAARTKPLYMGHLLYQLSKTAPQVTGLYWTQPLFCSSAKQSRACHVPPAHQQPTQLFHTDAAIRRDHPHSLPERRRWHLSGHHSSQKPPDSHWLVSKSIKTGTENNSKLRATHTSTITNHSCLLMLTGNGNEERRGEER